MHGLEKQFNVIKLRFDTLYIHVHAMKNKFKPR